MTSLNSAILKTLTYFDIFDCPLTVTEIRNFLTEPLDLLTLQLALDTLVGTGTIKQQNGFYTLRLENIFTRQTRFATARRKLKKARLIARCFSVLPWIHFVGLTNQMGSHNLRDAGDLDFFIITDPGRLWLTRFLCAGAMALFNQRPNDSKNQDTICLSFFVTSDALELKPYHLADTQDLYFIYWLANLSPIYDRDNAYQALIKANDWLPKALPNWQVNENILKISKPLSCFWPCWRLFQPLEVYLKAWQIKHLPVEIKSAPSTNVVISDRVLKLHDTDRRREFLDKYDKRLIDLIN